MKMEFHIIISNGTKLNQKISHLTCFIIVGIRIFRIKEFSYSDNSSNSNSDNNFKKTNYPILNHLICIVSKFFFYNIFK